MSASLLASLQNTSPRHASDTVDEEHRPIPDDPTTAPAPVTPFTAAPPTEEYGPLLAEALALIDTLAGETWNERGEHDPGLTLLELLCYSLGHMLQRYDISLPDLLAAEPGHSAWSKVPCPDDDPCGRERLEHTPGSTPLPRPEVFLDSMPVSAADYRLFILRERTVAAAWVSSEVDGNATAWPALVEFFGVEDEQEQHYLLNSLNNRLDVWRGLGQPAPAAAAARPVFVHLRGQVELQPGTDPETALADIWTALEEWLRPLATTDPVQPLRQADAAEARSIVLGCSCVRDALAIRLEVASGQKETPLAGNGASPFLPPSPGEEQPDRLAEYVADKETGSLHLRREDEVFVLRHCSVTFTNAPQPVAARAAHLAARKRRASNPALQRPKGRTRPAPGTWRPQPPHQSLHNLLPSLYGLDAANTPSPDEPERLAAVRQLQGFIIICEQFLADLVPPLAQSSRWLNGYTPGPDLMAGSIEHCPALPVLAGSKERYRQRLIAHQQEHQFARVHPNLIRHLAARHAHDPVGGARTELGSDQTELAGQWLAALPYLDKNRFGAHPGSLAHQGLGLPGGNALEERLAFFLAQYRERAPGDPRCGVFLSRENNPHTERDEYRFYLQDGEGAPLWAGLRLHHRRGQAVYDAARALRACACRERYRVTPQPPYVLSVLDEKGEQLAESAASLTSLDMARHMVERSMQAAQEHNLPWVKVVEGTSLYGREGAFRLYVLLAAENVPQDCRHALELEFRAHIPAHLLPRFFWLDAPQEEAARQLYAEAAHTPDYAALAALLRRFQRKTP